LKQAQEDEATALSAKETACTTRVMFSNGFDALESHRCIEDVLDYTTTNSYITVKAGCETAKVALVATTLAVAETEHRVSQPQRQRTFCG